MSNKEKAILAISMSAEEKALIMQAAKKEGRTASGFVRFVVLNQIKKNK